MMLVMLVMSLWKSYVYVPIYILCKFRLELIELTLKNFRLGYMCTAQPEAHGNYYQEIDATDQHCGADGDGKISLRTFQL